MCLNFILGGACASISDDTVNSAAPLLLLLQLLPGETKTAAAGF